MTISTAFEKIFNRIPGETEKESEIKKILESLRPIDHMKPFSVAASQRVLSDLVGAKPPNGHIELDSYIEALSDEIIRSAAVLHSKCTCGAPVTEHTYVYFLLYVGMYLITEYPIAGKMASQSIMSNLGVVHDFMKFRPSQN